MKSKTLLLIIISAVIILVECTAFAQSHTKRIMCLGDSITVGSGEVEDNNYKIGYRLLLWQMLNNLGYNIDFVGSLESGSSVEPTFDGNHEGHGGYTTSDIFANIDYWLSLPTGNPDIILLHIGTNDIGRVTNKIITDNINGILDSIFSYRNDITVILAQIINQKVKLNQITQLNDQLRTLAYTRRAGGDSIILVDMENAIVYPNDMFDSVHPKQSGYEKMANVWFDALDILFRPQVLLVTDKMGLGMGSVVSSPAAIDCGEVCSAYLDRGMVVTLTATADHGSVFSGWDGCDSVNGNVCEVSMHSDRRVTVDFRVASNVNLLFPTGGEIIPAGSQYTVAWEAPLNAVRFRLSGPKGCGIGTRFFTDTSATCDAPLLQKNKNNCFMKVIAYDSRNKKIGYDTPDSKFTIEVVTITSPNEETVCTGGQICPINWNKSVYVHATSIELYYSLKNGAKWSRIPGIEKLSPDAGTFNGWIAPNVSKPSTKCKLRIILRDSEGKIVGRHISVGTFTIQPVF